MNKEEIETLERAIRFLRTKIQELIDDIEEGKKILEYRRNDLRMLENLIKTKGE